MEAIETKDIFERMAGRYDTEERAATARIIAGAIRAALPGARDKAALDYGCGTGLVGLELVDLFRSLLFVDASPGMIAQVRRKIAERGITTADTLSRDFVAEGPPEGLRADIILLSQVLLHVRDIPRLLGVLHGVLNPGGSLVIVDFDKNERVQSDKVHNGFTHAELAGQLEQAGFSPAAARTFHRGERMFMNEDASLFLLVAKK